MQRVYKFTKQDIQKIQDFINTIDKSIKVKKGRCFECDIEQNQIFVGNKKFDKDTEMFMTWLCKQKEYTPINYIMISILHELGHIKTYEPRKEQERSILYGIYDFLGHLGIMTTEQQNNRYFNIPDERDATMWGLEYYVNHKSQCDKLVKDLCIM